MTNKDKLIWQLIDMPIDKFAMFVTESDYKEYFDIPSDCPFGKRGVYFSDIVDWLKQEITK